MFSAEKIVQEISYLLSLNGGSMDLLKLMKKLYLIDRESINERDTSLSGDNYVSMPLGPVLSITYNILNDLTAHNWNEFIKREGKKISLKKETSYDRLSKKDIKYIEDIFYRYKDMTSSQIVDYTHKLPEWVDPNGSSIRIKYRDIMRALDKTEEEISTAKLEYKNISEMYDCLGA